MNISAINNHYNVATKAQYDNYQTPEINNYPIYEEEEESSKSSNLLTLGLAALGVAGIGIGIAKHVNSKKVVKELAEKKTALEEALKNLEQQKEKTTEVQKALNKANEDLEKLKKPAKKSFNFFKGIWEKFKNWKRGTIF